VSNHNANLLHFKSVPVTIILTSVSESGEVWQELTNEPDFEST